MKSKHTNHNLSVELSLKLTMSDISTKPTFSMPCILWISSVYDTSDSNQIGNLPVPACEHSTR